MDILYKVPSCFVRWEMDENYCKDELLNPTSKYHKDILEYTDTCIFDFLMG